MSARPVVVVGAGRRVRETALPALARLPERFAVRRVLARSARVLEVGGALQRVEPLDALEPEDMAEGTLVYIAVGKDALPAVLARLVALGPERAELLIDTPVVRFRHFRHVALLRRFLRVSVAEDCAALPWLDAVHACLASGAIGALASVDFHHSAYAYHGLAMAKALFGAQRVRRARRRRARAGSTERTLVFADGRVARMHEPRDYARGWIVLTGSAGAISDRPGEAGVRLEPIVAGEQCLGFRCGEHETRLDRDELALAAGDPPGASVVARMEAQKRVGFLRLLRAIAAGAGAYPLDEALDDMVVDYSLERLGRFVANPLTSPRSALGRLFLAALSRAGG